MSNIKFQIPNKIQNPKISKFGSLSFNHWFEIRNLSFGFHGDEGGFIALISAIIIAFVLITVTVVLNFVAFYGRFNVLDSEFKETSVALAEACVDVAILEISKGSLPVIGSPISVGSAECTVASIAGSTTKIIKIQAIYKGAYTNLKVSFTPLSQTINSWIECPGTCP